MAMNLEDLILKRTSRILRRRRRNGGGQRGWILELLQMGQRANQSSTESKTVIERFSHLSDATHKSDIETSQNDTLTTTCLMSIRRSVPAEKMLLCPCFCHDAFVLPTLDVLQRPVEMLFGVFH